MTEDAKKEIPGLVVGGILWKGTPFMSELAVIHRTEEGSEWLLPKGEIEVGENPQKGALQVVKSQTGCKAKIISFACFESFKAESKENLVFCWHMQLVRQTRGTKKQPLFWLTPATALKLLTSEDQKRLIDSSVGPDCFIFDGRKDFLIAGQPKMLRKRGFSYWFGGNKNRKSRLLGAVSTFQKSLESKLGTILKNEQRQFLNKASELLVEARLYANSNELDIAWKCFHEAQRQEILALNSEALKDVAIIIRNESEKLGQWRRSAIEELLGKNGQPLAKDLNHETVYRAAQIRDEHYNNNAYKDRLFKNYLITILVCLVASSFLVFAYLSDLYYCFFPAFRTTLFGVFIFGIFGGAFSALLKIPSERGPSRIPEQVYAIRLSLTRVLIGGASALFIYVFIQTALVTELTNVNAVNEDNFLIYVISFAAGFSERLVLKAVSAVTKE